jgi:NADH dehydrogenase
VIIVGGGFGGLYAARALARAPVRVTLLDRRNHHVFQPLLYQVATAALSPGDIASPIRWILRRQPNIEVLLADVRHVDPARRTVVLTDGEMGYDYLILATGATHAYFGRDEWRDVAPGLKTLEDALEIRRRVLLAFERAERESDPAKRKSLLTFVVIGGGPTGVELAGALAEISRQSLARDFRHFDPGSAQIVLVEAGASLLTAFPEPLSTAARRDLTRLGVDVRTGSMVTALSPGRVEMGDTSLEAATVLWAAGVAASPVGATLGVATDRAGRVFVQPDLTIPGHAEVFVVGDLASVKGAGGKPLPGVAQVAIQTGRHAARNIRRAIEGQPYRPFTYRDLGNMATIGRASAIADFGWLQLKGWFAWLAWLFVHIMNLVGFRNRILVLVQWAWAYVTYQRAVRLITGEECERDSPK